MGGGTVAEKIYGTEEGRRKNRIMDSQMTHWGEQSGKLKDGVDKFFGDTNDFFERNTRSLRPQDEGGNNEAQTASANYTGQASTQRSGSGKRGSCKLTSKDTKKKQSKKALTITK